VPYFSSQQEDPRVRRTHRALEHLSDETQHLLWEFMADNRQFTEGQMDRLTRLCRAAVRRLRDLTAE
jgi:hypothetical protein